LGWDAERTQSALEDRYGSTAAPTILSLAREIHARSNTGTFTFQNPVSLPRGTRPDPTWRIPLPKPAGGRLARTQYLTLDVDFYGVTTLFSPSAEEHKVE
jgi:protein SERAC1